MFRLLGTGEAPADSEGWQLLVKLFSIAFDLPSWIFNGGDESFPVGAEGRSIVRMGEG
jgi:hypothetical protein